MHHHHPDEPGQFVDEPSVSGRSQPRPVPVPEGFRHDMRICQGADSMYAECKPCEWSIWLDGGHDLADLISLYVQHAGAEHECTRPIAPLSDRVGHPGPCACKCGAVKS